MTENFPPINVRHRTIGPGSSKNTEKDKCQKDYMLALTFKLQKIEDKNQTWKEARGIKHLIYRAAKTSITSDFSQENT